jgi:hypothetical protein
VHLAAIGLIAVFVALNAPAAKADSCTGTDLVALVGGGAERQVVWVGSGNPRRESDARNTTLWFRPNAGAVLGAGAYGVAHEERFHDRNRRASAQ